MSKGGKTVDIAVILYKPDKDKVNVAIYFILSSESWKISVR